MRVKITIRISTDRLSVTANVSRETFVLFYRLAGTQKRGCEKTLQCHGEELSDVAISIGFITLLWDCHGLKPSQ